VTDAVWSDMPREGKPGASSVIRRNLQREHLKELTNLVLGKKPGGGFAFFLGGSSRPAPADARSLARLHLRDLQKRIGRILDDDVKLDELLARPAAMTTGLASFPQLSIASHDHANDPPAAGRISRTGRAPDV
jgi:hypothetical protein